MSTETKETTEVTEETAPQTRDSRQRELVPPTALANVHATIIGVGAIGRQVALQCAAMGVPHLTLVDHDTVDIVNLGPQGFKAADVGKPKVIAVAADCSALNPDAGITAVQSRWGKSMSADLGNTLFCCVDSMEARKFIWESWEENPTMRLWVDGRMSAEVMRILTYVNETPSDGEVSTYEDYEATLFEDSQAFQGSCTAKSTIYSASIAAGFMVAALARWLRKQPPTPDILLNLLSGELATQTTGGFS